MRQFFVYILSSRSRQLYIGVTNNLERRVAQHRESSDAYTARYRIHRLVYYETTGDPSVAIRREKQLKAYRRAKKIALITSVNPAWNDLAVSLGIVDGRYPSTTPADPSSLRSSG